MTAPDTLTTTVNGVVSNRLSLKSIIKEPWYSIATGGQATLNTESIYQMGNVNIGTTANTGLLTLGGGETSNGLRFAGGGLNSADKKLYSPVDGVLEWMTHNSAVERGFAVSHQGAKAVFLSTLGNSYLMGGNVGIGTTTPTNRLHVTATSNPLRLEGLVYGATSDSVLTANSTGVVRKLSVTDLVAGAASEPWFNVATGTGATANTQNIYQMGNVGIGTNSANHKLFVNGNIAVRQATSGTGNKAYEFIGLQQVNGAESGSGGLVVHHEGLIATDTTTRNSIAGNFSGTLMSIRNIAGRALTIPQGTVGIGTWQPTNQLHVTATANPLRLEGLQAGAATDSIMTINSAGVVRRLSAADVTNAANNNWRITGNAGTTPPTSVGAAVGANNYWGTSDAKNLAVGTNGTTRAIFDQNGNINGGSGSTASGVNSIIWGLSHTNTGNQNAVFGNNNILIGGNSIVAGGGNKDSADYTLVAGNSNIVSKNSNSTLTVGDGNINLGSWGSIMGGQNNILQPNTEQSIVVGFQDTLVDNAPGNAVFGYYNRIQGGFSLVSGNNNKAKDAFFSLISGSNNIDSARYTLVAGLNNIVSPSMRYATVIGSFNQPVSNSLFLIGNGTGAGARSNVMTALTNGNVGIGTTTPTNRLHVTATSNPLRLEGLQAGAATDQDLAVDATGVVKLKTAKSVLNFTSSVEDTILNIAGLMDKIMMTFTIPNPGRYLVLHQWRGDFPNPAGISYNWDEWLSVNNPSGAIIAGTEVVIGDHGTGQPTRGAAQPMYINITDPNTVVCLWRYRTYTFPNSPTTPPKIAAGGHKVQVVPLD